MKKLNYTQPEMEMVKFGVSDVLATSGVTPGYNPEAIEGGGWVVGPNSSGNDQGFAL
ncbi:MAG: hypothetical protein IJJ41_04675 [Clostridia bacterium]|nr:hypothetical protein [Clostridia bacterium]MBR0414959.1 hypothetical protein [Clostridia bacterium]